MNQRCLPLAALGLALNLLSVGAADWPNFRGPHGSGISQETNLPATWSDQENVVWKIDLPGPGSSSPVVWGDKVFVTCYTGYGIDKSNPGNQEDLRRHLVCVDRKNGYVLWNKQVKAKLPEQRYSGPYITRHGYASSTPAIDGERIYVFFGKTGVLAFNFEGKELWHADLGDNVDPWGTGSSPVLYKDLVIVNAGVESGAVVALNKTNGSPVWKAGGIEQSWATPALVDVKGGKQELVLNAPNKIIGLDPDNGKELWHCEGIDDYICPSVASLDGIVCAIGARTNSAVAVKAGGMGDVTKTNRLWTKRVGSNVTSPSIYQEHVYWVNDRGTAYCLKVKDGAQVYQHSLDGGVYASITIADGKIYVVSQKGGTFVLAAGPTFLQLAHNTLSDDSTFNGSPAISRGQIFLRSDKRLYCIGKK
jgi:outer membrane protein assembly factor BamB